MSVLADTPAVLDESTDTVAVPTSDLYRQQWIELATRANLTGDVRAAEVLSLALATLPHTSTILAEHAQHGIPDEHTARWLAWVLDGFDDLCATVEDLDDAEQQMLVVEQIDPDEVVTDEATLDMFEQNLTDELDALLSGPAREVAA